MKNLELLEFHRKKVALVVAFFIFFSIYAIIFAFQFTSIYNHEQTDNEILKIKSQKIETILDSFNNITQNGDNDAHNIVQNLLDDTNIYNSDGIILQNFETSAVNTSAVQLDVIFYHDGYKYLKKQFGLYVYMVRIPSEDVKREVGNVFIIFIIFGIILYSFISWIMCRVMTRIYRPLSETVSNLEAFTSNVNHEFKTTLTEIISSLELAEITKDYEAANTQSSGAAKRLNRILDSLGVLIHFTNSNYRKQKVDVVKILDESLGDYNRKLGEKGITIKRLYNENIPAYRILDIAPLTLAFNNIFKNAIKFSKPSGVIEIDIKKDYFTIKDYGVGIEKENLDKIFDRYFRENYIGEGNGIGLSIIKRLSEIYNWEIIVNSEKDEFTEIKICF